MNITIAGGAGAMGLIFGARLAAAGHEVCLLDVHQPSIDRVNAEGIQLTAGAEQLHVKDHIHASRRAGTAADLLLLFTKCYHTADALALAQPCIHAETTILSLQNGWGNLDIIQQEVPASQVMAGVTYVSGTLLAPGHSRQAGNPAAFIGRPDGLTDDKARRISSALTGAGIRTDLTAAITEEIFRKLAINITTLPLAALIRLQAHQLLENAHTVALMDSLLEEMTAVTAAMGLQLSFDERRSHIHDLLGKAVGAKGSMLQDVEAHRRTEIDVINGAIVSLGERHGVPTPVNYVLVRLIKALELTYQQSN